MSLSVMIPLGWVPLDGRSISEADYPTLFTLTSLQGLIQGTAPNRTIILPNADNKVLMTKWGSPAARTGGPANNQATLALPNMPQHNHNVSMGVAGSGPISARVSRSGTHGHGISGGSHGHDVVDDGHNHNGAEWINQSRTAVIAVVWGGQNKIDAMFNDRNHTYSVEALDWIAPSQSNVTVATNPSHSHNVDQAGDHDHQISVDSAPNHVHAVAQEDRGLGTPFDITPSYLSTYTYIRS